MCRLFEICAEEIRKFDVEWSWFQNVSADIRNAHQWDGCSRFLFHYDFGDFGCFHYYNSIDFSAHGMKICVSIRTQLISQVTPFIHRVVLICCVIFCLISKIGWKSKYSHVVIRCCYH